MDEFLFFASCLKYLRVVGVHGPDVDPDHAPYLPVVAGGFDSSSSLCSYPGCSCYEGVGSYVLGHRHGIAILDQVPMHGPPLLGCFHLDCLVDVYSDDGHVFAYPSHCRSAIGGFLDHEIPSCFPAHHRAPLASDPVIRGWGAVCCHRIPTFPISVVHRGERLNSPDHVPLSSVPCCPSDECRELSEPPNGHHPSNQRYHTRLCRFDDGLPMGAYRSGPVNQHGTKDRPCSYCSWTWKMMECRYLFFCTNKGKFQSQSQYGWHPPVRPTEPDLLRRRGLEPCHGACVEICCLTCSSLC